jgi:hypothetical protein
VSRLGKFWKRKKRELPPTAAGVIAEHSQLSAKARLFGKRASSITIVLLLGIIGYLAYNAYDNQYHPKYTFSIPTGAGSFIGRDCDDCPLDVNVNVFLTTTSLSAQNPISVDVRIYPNERYDHAAHPWRSQVESEYIIFPLALKYPLSTLADGDYESGFIKLERYDSPDMEYRGRGEIIYQFQGNYSFTFIPTADVEERSLPNGLTSFYLDELAEKYKGKEVYFIVGSEEQTSDLKNNAIILSLTLVIIGIAVIEIREIITDGFAWIYRRFKK